MTDTTHWWWIRHAPVVQKERRIYGNSDVPCDCSDSAMFARLAERLPHNAVWVTSSLTRTYETAAAIAAHHPDEAGVPHHQDAKLNEQSFGDWQGRTPDELEHLRGGEWHRFWLAPATQVPPGGESFAQLLARVRHVIDRLNQDHAGRDLIVVAHGGTIRAALALALDLNPERALGFEIANCSLTRLTFHAGAAGSHAPDDHGIWSVGLVNGSDHLIG